MNRQKLRGKWDQTKGLAREFWGELTGDDLNFIAGQRDRLIGRLEAKYQLMQVELFERKIFSAEKASRLH